MRTPHTRLGAGALIVALAFTAVACGDDDDNGNGAATTAATATTEGSSPASSSPSSGGERETVSADDWATGVCTSVGDWVQSVQSGAGEFTSALADVTDPEAAKESLTEFADQVLEQTNTMLDGVDAAGAPDIENGQDLANELNANLANVRTVFEELQAGIADLPTDSPQAFAQAGQDLVSSLNEGMQAFGDAFNDVSTKYQSDELQQAFADNEACGALRGSS